MNQLSKILTITCLIISIAQGQTVETLVTGGNFNDGIALDQMGNIYIAYYGNSNVNRVTPEGVETVFADGFTNPNGIQFDADGNLWVPSNGSNQVYIVGTDGNSTLEIPSIGTPTGIEFDADGNAYITQYGSNRVSRYDTEGVLEYYNEHGDLNGPVDLEVSANGTVYIANYNDGRIFRVHRNSGQLIEVADIPGSLGFTTLVGDVIYATGITTNFIYAIDIIAGGYTIFAGTGSAGSANGSLDEATFNGPNGIAATPDGDTLYISDYNTRNLRRIVGINSATDLDDKSFIQPEFKLGQNYPNPFNPSTTIGYTLPESGSVLITILNSNGQRVDHSYNSIQNAGSHNYNFDGSGLSSGVYIYQIRTRDQISQGKMLLVK